MKIQLRQRSQFHAKQGGDWRPAHAQAGCRAGRLRPHVQVVRHWVAGGGQAVLGLSGLGVRSIPGAFGHLRVRGHHLHLRILDGKPVWFQQQDGGSQGASGPGGSQKAAGRKLVDGSNLGRPPPKTDSMDEITMADVVPLDKRVDTRQETLTMCGRGGHQDPGGPPGAVTRSMRRSRRRPHSKRSWPESGSWPRKRWRQGSCTRRSSRTSSWTMRWRSWPRSRRACSPCRRTRWQTPPSGRLTWSGSGKSSGSSTWRGGVRRAKHSRRPWARSRRPRRQTSASRRPTKPG